MSFPYHADALRSLSREVDGQLGLVVGKLGVSRGLNNEGAAAGEGPNKAQERRRGEEDVGGRREEVWMRAR